MSDEWILLVNGKEYGPVEVETLFEWKTEGRVLPHNAARRAGEATWGKASDIPALFGPPPLPPPLPEEDARVRSRTMGEIITETFRIYGRSFVLFFSLALLTELPLFFLRVNAAPLQMPSLTASENQPAPTLSLPPGTLERTSLLVVVALLLWTLYIPAVQLAAAKRLGGTCNAKRGALFPGVRSWLRVVGLFLLVHGAYAFWLVMALVPLISVASQPSLSRIFFSLLLASLAVYMIGRLFIHFLFWQQCAVLEKRTWIGALRESRQLARNRMRLNPTDRPLFRGALLASLWLFFFIVLGTVVQVPFVMARLGLVQDVEQAIAELNRLSQAPTSDALMLGSYIAAGLASALLKPLLGISFVVLFFDARSDFPALENEEV